MDNTTTGFFAYVLYLCIQSHMTCDVVKENVKTVRGTETSIVRYGKMEWCKEDAARRSNVEPDKDGYYFIEYNKWYECRKEAQKQPELNR